MLVGVVSSCFILFQHLPVFGIGIHIISQHLAHVRLARDKFECPEALRVHALGPSVNEFQIPQQQSSHPRPSQEHTPTNPTSGQHQTGIKQYQTSLNILDEVRSLLPDSTFSLVLSTAPRGLAVEQARLREEAAEAYEPLARQRDDGGYGATGRRGKNETSMGRSTRHRNLDPRTWGRAHVSWHILKGIRISSPASGHQAVYTCSQLVGGVCQGRRKMPSKKN